MRIACLFWLVCLAVTVTVPSRAGELCDNSCLLTIDFPSGGAIDANEPVTFTFGNSGIVNTGGTVTAYLQGEQLILNAGESLQFSDGGRFDIGNAGNVEYSDIDFTISGQMQLTASGGNERITVGSGDRFAIEGDGVATLKPGFLNEGTVEVGDGATLSLVGQTSSSSSGACANLSGATLVSTAGPLIVDATSSCADISNQLSAAGLMVTTSGLSGSLIVSNSDLTVNDASLQSDIGDDPMADTTGASNGGAGSFVDPIALLILIALGLSVKFCCNTRTGDKHPGLLSETDFDTR